MPRKIIAYGCEFRCGGRIFKSIKAMEAHEKNCFSNPKVRACRICGNHRNDYVEGFYCEIDVTLNGMRRDCEKWIPG